MADIGGQERTERATDKKRNEERGKGNVPKSMEINTAAMFAGLIFFFVLVGGDFMQTWIAMFQKGLSTPKVWVGTERFPGLYTFWATQYFKLVAPLFGLFVVVAVLANYFQIGWLVAWEKLKPKVGQLNPIKGFKKFVSLTAFVELGKSIFKVLFLGWIAVSTIRPEVKTVVLLFNWPLSDALLYGAALAFKLVSRILMAVVFMALLDLFYQRWNHERQLKMTKQEVKDERKQSEGDPKIKSKIRAIQMDQARKRMMQEVPLADVVITNPTHVAVAIRYHQNEDFAPVVTAKGGDLLCEQIKNIAREHNIPIVENPSLARLLYKSTDLGQEIPLEVYRAVAEILAYVYRLKGKVSDGVAGG